MKNQQPSKPKAKGRGISLPPALWDHVERRMEHLALKTHSEYFQLLVDLDMQTMPDKNLHSDNTLHLWHEYPATPGRWFVQQSSLYELNEPPGDQYAEMNRRAFDALQRDGQNPPPP